MHLLDPDDTAVIDGELVCDTISRLPSFDVMHDWVKRFAVLADPTRLTVLLCMHRAGEICVTDLAAAAGIKDTTASQALRLLRAHEIVAARRAGRIMYYRLADPSIEHLLGEAFATPAAGPHAVEAREPSGSRPA